MIPEAHAVSPQVLLTDMEPLAVVTFLTPVVGVVVIETYLMKRRIRTGDFTVPHQFQKFTVSTRGKKICAFGLCHCP